MFVTCNLTERYNKPLALLIRTNERFKDEIEIKMVIQHNFSVRAQKGKKLNTLTVTGNRKKTNTT